MKYKTIYADPPWPLAGGGGRGVQKKYRTMSIDEIKLMGDWVDDISAENSHLYMWVVNNFLLEGIEVMKAWRYQPITNFVWVKDSIGLGHYSRSQHEILLFGRKGRAMVPEPSSLHSSVVHAPRMKHSAKPHEFYDLIESTSPGPYLELFARNYREGWHCWGNEVQCSIRENYGFWKPAIAA